jgi:hypothetical protein
MTSEDKTKALNNPSSFFKRPREVVACAELSRAEKTEILKQWELDARLLQVATEEGMEGKGEADRSLLGEVKAAQKQLDVGTLKQGGAPSKSGP